MTVFLSAFADELVKVSEAEPKSKKSALRRAAELGLAGAVGYGAYRYGRKVKLSKDPALRAIQKKSKGRLSHLEALDEGQKPATGLRKKYNELVRGVDEVIEEPVQKWGPRADIAEDIAFGPATVKDLERLGKPKEVKGALHAMLEPSQHYGFKADLPLGASTPDVLRAASGKLEEARYFSNLPKTESVIGHMRKVRTGGPKSDAEILDNLQATLAKKYPSGYILKPDLGQASGGVPTHNERWADLLTGGDPVHQKWIRGLLKKPDKYIVQEYIPIAKERVAIGKLPRQAGKSGRSIEPFAEVPIEYRVHAFAGRVVPGGSQHRWAGGREINPFKRREIREMEKAVQDQLDKLPAGSREMPLALDVVKTKDGAWKVIEMNPGGRSGFLAPDVTKTVGLAPHATYKAITGRQSKLEAGVKATAAAGGTSVVAGSIGEGGGIPPEA